VFEQDVSESGVVTVLSIEEKEGRKARPLPFNTVELLKAASKGLGMSPSAAMSCAERLYLSGSVSALVSHTPASVFTCVWCRYISYPRTESTQYPASFDLREAVSEQTGSRYWGDYARKLLSEGLSVR
jgi:DNA topoisomerase III